MAPPRALSAIETFSISLLTLSKFVGTGCNEVLSPALLYQVDFRNEALAPQVSSLHLILVNTRQHLLRLIRQSLEILGGVTPTDGLSCVVRGPLCVGGFLPSLDAECKTQPTRQQAYDAGDTRYKVEVQV